MTRPTVYLFINGINHWLPSLTWNTEAAQKTWEHFNGTRRSAAFWYPSIALRLGFGQRWRALELLKLLKRLAGFRIIMVTHSNGINVLRNALAIERFKVEHLIAISPACDRDMEVNGLNESLLNGDIAHLHRWRAGKDKALRFGQSWLGKLMGYGGLGNRAAINTDHRLKLFPQVHYEPGFAHSDWFTKDNMNDTMNRIWDIGEQV
jgi:hypothetical protein